MLQGSILDLMLFIIYINDMQQRSIFLLLMMPNLAVFFTARLFLHIINYWKNKPKVEIYFIYVAISTYVCMPTSNVVASYLKCICCLTHIVYSYLQITYADLQLPTAGSERKFVPVDVIAYTDLQVLPVDSEAKTNMYIL